MSNIKNNLDTLTKELKHIEADWSEDHNKTAIHIPTKLTDHKATPTNYGITLTNLTTQQIMRALGLNVIHYNAQTNDTINKPLPETLPNVLDALKAADQELLAKLIEQRFKYALLHTPKNGIQDWLKRLIAELDTIEHTKDDKHVLVAHTIIDNDLDKEQTLHIDTTTTLFNLKEIKKWINDTLHGLDTFRPSGYAYEFSSWEEMLSWDIYIPSYMCEYEATQALADFIWELTWFGDTQETVQENSQEMLDSLEKSIKESDELIKNKDNAKNAFKTMDDIYDEYGFERPSKRERDLTQRTSSIMFVLSESLEMINEATLIDLAKIKHII